jgi:hypothetical protein
MHPVYALPRTSSTLSTPSRNLRRRCAAPARHAAVCMLLAWLAFTTATPPPPPLPWCTQALHNHSIAHSSPAPLSSRSTICSTAVATPLCAVCQAACSERGVDGGDCSGKTEDYCFSVPQSTLRLLIALRLPACLMSNTTTAHACHSEPPILCTLRARRSMLKFAQRHVFTRRPRVAGLSVCVVVYRSRDDAVVTS